MSRARRPPSFDKQYVRDFVAASGWNKEPPAPTLPDEVIAGTRDRYVTAYERLTGRPGSHRRASPMRWLAEVHVRAAPGDRRSGGPDHHRRAARPGLSTRSSEVRSRQAAAHRVRGRRPRRRGGGGGRDVPPPARQPGDGDRRLGAARRRAEPEEGRDSPERAARAWRWSSFPGPGASATSLHVAERARLGGASRCGTPRPSWARPDAVVLPGGFAHGDHLRTGAIARFSPIMARGRGLRRGRRPGHRLVQRLPDPDRGRDAARRADAQRPPRVPL